MAESSNSFTQVVTQLGESLRALSNRQKLWLAGAALLVGITLFFFVRMMANPEMKPLISAMTPQDAQALSAQLTSKNIRHQISQDGATILVPADQLDQARLEAASNGSSRSGRLGFELFDKPNWGGSDFSEKVNYQRALEGELERTIQSLRPVEAVRVHLVMPGDSVFLDRQREAKASVVLRLRGRRLDPEAQTAIANLVSGAVENLRPEMVSVIDAETNRPILRATGTESTNTGVPYEDQLAQHLVRSLEPVVGADHVRANVHVERDSTSGEETQETYDPNSTVALTMQRTEERSGSVTTGGIPGTASNVPGAGTQSIAKNQADDSSQLSKSENGTYAVNRLTRHTVVPAGRVKRITAAILVDDAVEQKMESGKSSELRRKRSPEELRQIEDLARASLGLDQSRGDVLSVQNLSFRTESPEIPGRLTIPQRVQTIIQQWTSLLRYLAILLLFLAVYAMVLRPVKKQLLVSLREAPRRAISKTSPAITGELSPPASQSALQGESATPESVRLKKQIIDKVRSEPAASSRLLQTWIREGGAQ